MNAPTTRPDYSNITINGFLGFPHCQSPATIDIDGDIILLSGPNGAGKSSLLEAIALAETGESYRPHEQLIHRSEQSSKSFSIQIGDLELDLRIEKDLITSFYDWWQSEEKGRKLHLRPVYFHPHYLDKLFEEKPEDAGTSFIDLLAPPPQAVAELRDELGSTLSTVDSQIARLEKEGGFISEAEQKDQRRQHARAFNNKIGLWKETLPETSQWLAEPNDHPLVLKSGNMSASWQRQLNKFTGESLKQLGEQAENLSVSSTSTTAESLRTLAEAAQLAPKQHQATAIAETADTPASLPSEIAEQLSSLDNEQWAQLKRPREESAAAESSSSFSEKQLSERLDEVRRLRNELGRGEAGFPDWIARFQQRCEKWSKVQNAKQFPVPLPGEFQSWLEQASALAQHWSKCESYWAEWSAQLDDVEKKLSFEREQLQVRRSRHRHITTLASRLDSLFAQRPDAREQFALAETAEGFLSTLTQRTDAQLESPRDKRNPVEAFVTACNSWADFEQRVEDDMERRKSSDHAERQKRIDDLKQLRDAIETESKANKNSRLGRLQQEAVDAALSPLEGFLNRTATQFRIFDGIRPIRLDPVPNKRQGDRMALRVGKPPREIGQTSSGQRSQLGLLTFLALHYGLRDTYQSKILCLDEVTSSFDLAQIPRLALLLRQIAYAPKDSEFKRRVFIASHNEEFSQRLAELLTPPDGNALRILRFKGYDPASGPQIESSSIQPALPFNVENIQSYFRYRYSSESS